MDSVMHIIFRQFEDEGIKYLHFKSNTNLSESFEGRGDFDVLIDSQRLADVERIIGSHSGKRFNPPRLGRYPGVDNWMLFDDNTGILYHLHLHYQLATGKTLVKDYIIPWTDLLYETRIKDSTYGLYITDPSLEILLLLVRTVVKSTQKQRLKAWLGQYHMLASMEEEFRDLKEKLNMDQFHKYADRCGFIREDIEIFETILQNESIDAKCFRNLYRIVRDRMKLDRRMSGFAASILSLYYTTRRKMASVIKNHTEKPMMIKKVHDSTGLIVAFIGVDGAGKSTVTKEIYKWLNKKIECKRFYMGSGDGRIPLSMRLINLIKQRKQSSGKVGEKAVQIQVVSFFRQPVKCVRRMLKITALYDVQKSNCKKIETMQKYRLNGGISLLDRYPQIEYAGMNDGPKIVEYRDSFAEKKWIDRMIKKESEKLDIVRWVKPDVIFRLNISAETSMARKPEQKNIETFRRKIEELNKITYQGATIVDIDAEQPYEVELLEIKRILWSLM